MEVGEAVVFIAYLGEDTVETWEGLSRKWGWWVAGSSGARRTGSRNSRAAWWAAAWAAA